MSGGFRLSRECHNLPNQTHQVYQNNFISTKDVEKSLKSKGLTRKKQDILHEPSMNLKHKNRVMCLITRILSLSYVVLMSHVP